MGILQNPTIKIYFNMTAFVETVINKMMPQDRFKFISIFLHFFLKMAPRTLTLKLQSFSKFTVD